MASVWCLLGGRKFSYFLHSLRAHNFTINCGYSCWWLWHPCLLIQQKMFHFSSVKQEVVRLNFSKRSEYSSANWRINRVKFKVGDKYIKPMECIWQLGEYILVYQIKLGKRNPGTKLFSLLHESRLQKSGWDQSQANGP